MPPLGYASERLYRALLRTYPAEYQTRYAAEMLQVFRSLYTETWSRAGFMALGALWVSAIWDGLQAALLQWVRFFSHKKVGMMDKNTLPQPGTIQPLSASDAIKAVLPFLLFGLTMLLEVYLPRLVPGEGAAPAWQAMLVNFYFFFYVFILAGLALGILAGFPRWTYSYLGWGLLFTFWWSLVSFSGTSFGVMAWIPFLGVLIIPLLVRHTLQPLVSFANGLWQDWTLFSLALYSFSSYVFLLYDENHHPYLWAFLACAALGVSLGAWGYFRLSKPIQRVLALFGGLLAAAILSEAAYTTWDYRAYYNLPASIQGYNPAALIFTVVLGLLMLITGLVPNWQHLRRPPRSPGSLPTP